MSICVARWFLENGLLLNPAKTEEVLFGTSAQRKKVSTASGLGVAGTVVPFRDTVKLLGVTLDSALTMDRHVTEVVRSCNYHIQALRHIRPLLTFDAANVIGLDYANALLYGTSAANIHRLQVVRNSLARVICQASFTVSSFTGFQFATASTIQTGRRHLQDQNNLYSNLPVSLDP